MFNPFKKKAAEAEPAKRTFVKLLTSVGEFEIDLFADDAPQTVANFLRLVRGEFYHGLKFHRVVERQLVQTGCPKGDGTGNPGYHIKCELGGPRQVHEEGVLSMAHTARDMAGSQFFICLAKLPHLDGNHACFGVVTKGLDQLGQISLGTTIVSMEVCVELPQTNEEEAE
jgi:peptidyl-prolyl cis-trans isomerase B (cyclophilin B)